MLYYSSAYASDYSTGWSAANAFRLPVGPEKALVASREFGILAFGEFSVWALAPSTTPSATDDKPQPVVTDKGCVSKFSVVEAFDDIYWFALVHPEVVENGIDPVTLEKGFGRVTRLCLYKDNTSFEGNPFLPSMTVRRQIFVNYQEEWSVLNSNNIDMTRDLINYLERRFSLRIVSC